ncbi:PAS domain-containing hybrid sensor histidine kinase/response regulator [Oceanidesulfovibrio indonesiensis]|nr:PAS domain-containing protein [Oceanidesulfovibrio indonesiensis]
MPDNTGADRKELERELAIAQARVAELEQRLSLDSPQTSSDQTCIPPFSQRLLARSGVVFWTRDVESGQFMFVSGAAMDCLGYTAEQLIHNADLLSDRMHPIEAPAGWEHADFENPYDIREEELRYFHPDGDIRRLRSCAQGAFDDQGRLIRTMGILEDITRHRQDIDSSMEYSNMLQSVLDSIQSAIFLLDAEGRYVFVNKHYADLFDVDSNEIVGKIPAAVHDPSTVKEFLRTDRIVVDTGRPFTVHESLPVHDEMRNFLTTKSPVFDENGLVAGICGIAMDITEQKSLENTLRETSGLLESIMDYSSSYIVIKNSRGEYVRVNRAFANDLETTPEDLAGWTDFEIFDHEQALHLRGIEERVLDTLEPYVFEHTRTIGGTSHHLLITCFPLPDGDGVPSGVCLIATDITDQHAAAEAIAANERRFRAILDSVDRIAIQGYDEARRVIFWNPSSERLYGFTSEEALGRQLESLIIPDHMRNEVLDAHNRWLNEGTPIPSGELVLRDKNGNDVEVYSSHVMYETLDDRRELYCVDVDLTEIKRMERELIKARDVAESASRAKSEFLANMSHEIRTPLNGIMGMLQLMGSDDLSGEQSRFLDIALTSCRNLTRLLSDILDLSRVEAGKMELVEEEFSLNEIIETLRPTYGDEARRRGIDLHIVVEDGFPDILIGDPVRLRQVLMNLVGNAIKFTEHGSVTLDVQGARGNEPQAFTMVAAVRDTGIGISNEKLSEIFEPFAQLEPAFKRKFQGAGLGLSIVKRLLQLMGGFLTIESEPGVGTTIQFSAPFRIAGDQQPADNPPQALSDDSMRLLLVEDDPVNSMVLRKLLEREGYAVREAPGGQRALELLAEQPVDLILMDIQMPGMNGIEATRRIRSGDVPGLDPRIPIIALTAYAMAGDRETLLQAGMDEYVAKPVDISYLRAILKRFSMQTD